MITPALQARPVMTPPPASMGRNWKPLYWLAAAFLLLVLELANGTEPVFAALVFVFAFLSYQAVRAAGGLTTLIGACIAFMAGQNVLVSQVAKVWLGQAADVPLMSPVVTISLYDLAMAGIWLAAAISTRWAARQRPLFRAETDVRRLLWLSYISAVFALLQYGIISRRVDADTGAMQNGGVFGPLSQIAYLVPLAIASGTAYVILASKGRRSLGFVNATMILVPLLQGIVGAGREGMATGIIIYAATCLAFKFKFRPIHYAVAVGGGCLLQFILFPYALYARDLVRTPRMDVNISRAISCLTDVIADPMKYQKILDKDFNRKPRYQYYGKSMPTLDRASLIVGADGVIDATLTQGTIGMKTITPGFYAAIPRVFYPDKPVGISNALAHRAPHMVGKEDFVTGVTLGWVCDAFSSFGWVGTGVIAFLISLAFFSAYRLVFDDRMPFNVVPLALLFHLPWQYSGNFIAALIVEVLQNATFFAVVYGTITLLVNLAMRAEVRIRQTKQRAGLELGSARARISASRRRTRFS